MWCASRRTRSRPCRRVVVAEVVGLPGQCRQDDGDTVLAEVARADDERRETDPPVRRLEACEVEPRGPVTDRTFETGPLGGWRRSLGPSRGRLASRCCPQSCPLRPRAEDPETYGLCGLVEGDECRLVTRRIALSAKCRFDAGASSSLSDTPFELLVIDGCGTACRPDRRRPASPTAAKTRTAWRRSRAPLRICVLVAMAPPSASAQMALTDGQRPANGPWSVQTTGGTTALCGSSRILGPDQAENENGPVALGGRQQRALLGLLLIRAARSSRRMS